MYPDLLSNRSASRTILAVRLEWLVEGDETGRPGPLETARRIVVDHGGRIASTSAQGVVAELRSPTDTLHCAAALQDRFASGEGAAGMRVEVRTAVTIGEVVREKGALGGEAVEHAVRLAAEATPGEVWFTRAVHLTMTRGELSWSQRQGPELGIGQPILRFLPRHAARGEALAFGGAGAEGRGGRRLVGAWRRVGDAARTRLSDLRKEGVTAARIRSHLLMPIAVVSLGVLAGVLSTLRLPPWPPPLIEASLAAGDFEEALRLVDDWRNKEADHPERLAWRARVLAETGELDEALLLLEDALARSPRLAHSRGVAWGMALTLDTKGADRSLLRRHRTPQLEQALLDATESERYWLRRNAVSALEKFGQGELIDRYRVLSLDLQHGGSCGVRIRAARELGELGDLRAVPLLEAARAERQPGAACNLAGAARSALTTLGASAER